VVYRLELRKRSVDLDWTTEPYEIMDYLLDGREFIDSVARAEREEGAAELAGSYLGLSAREIDWSRHLLGRAPEPTRAGRTLLLGCICSVYDCWPLYARITVGADMVTWSDFAHGHRDWAYLGLGPFTFERAQYEAAIALAS
jgi:hypothetical protein